MSQSPPRAWLLLQTLSLLASSFAFASPRPIATAPPEPIDAAHRSRRVQHTNNREDFTFRRAFDPEQQRQNNNGHRRGPPSAFHSRRREQRSAGAAGYGIHPFVRSARPRACPTRMNEPRFRAETPHLPKHVMQEGFVNAGLLSSPAAWASFLTQTSVVMTPLISAAAGDSIKSSVWGGLFLISTSTSTGDPSAAALFNQGDALILLGALSWSMYIFRTSRIANAYPELPSNSPRRPCSR